MLNVHVYSSPFRFESRTMKMTSSLIKLGIADSILMIGRWAPGLPPTESIGEQRSLQRVRTLVDGRGLVIRTISFLEWSLRVFFRLRKEQISLVNCHSLASLPLSCCLKWFHGAHLVYEPHELETETHGQHGPRKVLSRWVERRLIGKAERVVLVSESIREWYEETYRLGNTSVVFNCPSYSNPGKSSILRDRFSIAPQSAVFVYQGVLGPSRGLEILVSSFLDLDDRASLIFIGFGPLEAWLKDMASRYPNIHVHPAVSEQELIVLTASADFGISLTEPSCLSHEFALPNKLFQYLMAGNAVLTSLTKEQSEFVARYGVGVSVESFDRSGIQRAVERLLAMDRSRMDEAINMCRREYSWEQQEHTMQVIYSFLPGREAMAFSHSNGHAHA